MYCIWKWFSTDDEIRERVGEGLQKTGEEGKIVWGGYKSTENKTRGSQEENRKRCEF